MSKRTDNRYAIRREEDDKWTVYDVFTGMAAAWEGRMLQDLDISDAGDLVDLMNSRDADRRRSVP
jgi:hypothetical protein